MAGFPKLIPAFTALVEIETPTPVGPVASGNTLVHVVISPNKGSITSEPSYPIKLDATFVHGADFIRADPSGKHVRLEVHSVVKDKLTDGGLLRFNYTGVIGTEGANGKVLGGSPDAATTPFGDAFINASFETGVKELAAIQDKVYVGSGRFVLEEGKPVTVEYKISEVSY
ncbi:hypothetical protein QBC37DRAFT_412773 [Rhypophila decipiens]|uniref:Uncharacterized protein n=1 Tax=Rhypophila decipiens TaxID=261697 RepID=A0AAN7BEL5_9PEZI|nr:hypothetical protein QBC37DRAFT_412773 [Rhypophila decipiens]